MTTQPRSNDELLHLAKSGDREALAELFGGFRERLRRMIRLRLDPRLQGRIDSSDVLQETYLDVCKLLADYENYPDMSFFLWLRLVATQKLAQLHRFHLGTQKRDAGKEISLHRGAFPQASSVSLAAQLLGRLTTASQAFDRAESKIKLQKTLAEMDAVDREVLALRHFEYLSNSETAQVLGISKNAASNRYIRAIKRLKEIVASIPGLNDHSLE